MSEIAEERIEKALEEGAGAFWAAVVKHFPEARGADIDRDAALDLSHAMIKAIRAWLEANTTLKNVEDLGTRG